MTSLQDIVSLAKRRGFIFPGSEIYGGFKGFWDYGPLGVELKNNLKRLWWQTMVYDREDVVGLDAAITMNPQVWEASGHVAAFTDPLVECKNCHKRFRADHVVAKKKLSAADLTGEDKLLLFCSKGEEHDFTEPKVFNLLTEVCLGTTEPKQKAYLRGEITQGVFVNFQNVVSSTRVKIPFGIAQIGKAFRNEITPGNFTYRSREFEQMELEFFVTPDDKESQRWFTYWKEQRMNWYVDLGMNPKHLRFREHAPDERAHYAKAAEDIEFEAPFGWSEFEGIHHRGNWDLSRHKLTYKDESGEEYIPWVIETSGGVDRSALFFLLNAYHHDGKRTILKLHPQLAPFKVAVFPLLANKEKLITLAQKVKTELSRSFITAWDDRGNIGKRYLAQDEIGTPFCITVDFDSLKDDSVTVRDRDTTKQDRVAIPKLQDYLSPKLE
ncbi:MAG: glycine--tRNA ligase [Candidatus Chisholmbacteria bacterium]|nr:glycine--tRNA ligase [Candidatus Chisholmbacteria bacterium]